MGYLFFNYYYCVNNISMVKSIKDMSESSPKSQEEFND